MASYPLVLVDGPPRCGKSTAARQLAASSSAGAILARAGSPDGRRIMANPLSLSAARPVILDGATMDEARMIERALTTQPRTEQPAEAIMPQPGQPAPLALRLPRFVLVGGPFLQRTGSTHTDTANPVSARLSLSPLTLAEVGQGSVRTHWLRGGYPEAYTAGSDSAALAAAEALITGMCKDRLKLWGLPDSPTRLASLLSSLAESAGNPVNENGLARILGTSRPTVCRWMETFEAAGIVRRVPRLPGRDGARRIVQGPAWHIRDSGLLHGLHGIGSFLDLRSIPRLASASWQAYVLEQTAAVVSPETTLGSYLSADRACIDLVLIREDRIMAVSTRFHLPVSPGRGVTQGARALGATDCCLVVPEGNPRMLGGGFRTLGLAGFLDEVRSAFC